METWNDNLEIEGDLREELSREDERNGFDNLETEEEISEFERFLDDCDSEYDSDFDGQALESVFGPND